MRFELAMGLPFWIIPKAINHAANVPQTSNTNPLD